MKAFVKVRVCAEDSMRDDCVSVCVFVLQRLQSSSLPTWL